ncbi:hypothetical protein [Bradyrhizobium canariense]|uniref:Uncharacterized protein n=1 Tax=Bradyrhizobium canariense TaxID=255045 RepID=A0A1H2AM95_9BRAD|nr:hypothetical protein [Bradyrhizobium canariense]SDT46892.1 hypothetical protein SAMN05444158_6273 [Bradyrhizobium canariense]
MTLVFTRNRLPDPTLDRRSHRLKLRPGNYRFGRISAKPARAYASRVMSGVKAFFGAVLKVIAAAKLRRIEREFRVRGPHHDWLRIDDDHFTRIDH